MTTVDPFPINQFPAESGQDTRLTTWYAQGYSDGLGDRLLMFDNTSSPSWEILRFRRALARNSKFEAALRDQMERLSSFDHPAFPRVRSIEEWGQEDGLAVVSTYVSGVSLGEALKKPRSVDFAGRLLQQLVPALTALHEHGSQIVHGALTPDRILLDAAGQLILREHMVGSALASLELSAERLWSDFGILASARNAIPPLDTRNDLIQLALVTLALLAGRRLGPDDYPDAIPDLLDRIGEQNNRRGLVNFDSLRHWLERALALNHEPFESARDANDALADLERRSEPDDALDATLRRASTTIRLDGRATAGTAVSEDMRLRASPGTVVRETAGHADHRRLASGNAVVAPPKRRPIVHVIAWLAAAAGIIAIAEAAFIGRLMYPRDAVVTAVDNDRPTNDIPQPLRPSVVQDLPAPIIAPPSIVDQQEAVTRIVQSVALSVPEIRNTANEPLMSAAIASKRGGFRVLSPISLHVLDGDRLLGSSNEGPIIAAAGRHEFEFVNSVVGLRMRQMVEVTPGRITEVSVTVPNATVNINATPWADVWIDGVPYGETPLGNLSVVPGEHQILFRHPQLGERVQKIVLRPDVPGRVSINLQQ